jgi:hypothetical protein
VPAKRQLCVDCVHFRRCFELVPELEGDERECHWDPSRFDRTSSSWDRASHRALAVGRGGSAMGRRLYLYPKGRPTLALRTGEGKGHGKGKTRKKGPRGSPG